LVTDTSPLVPFPATAVMIVGETTVIAVAPIPPNFTLVIPVKFFPLIVTVV
jgi:hypothetical protein